MQQRHAMYLSLQVASPWSSSGRLDSITAIAVLAAQSTVDGLRRRSYRPHAITATRQRAARHRGVEPLCGVPREEVLKFPSNAAVFGGESLGNVLP